MFSIAMRINGHIKGFVAVALTAAASLTSCIYDDSNEEPVSVDTISINAEVLDGARRTPATASNGSGSTFMILFWMNDQKNFIELTDNGDWPQPYLEAVAPQEVSYYSQLVFDTGYPYPYPETQNLYATGYSPANVLEPDAAVGYRRISVPAGKRTELGRHDFQSCDAWTDVYRGSQSDPFAQSKNKLYFRHLASKLVFYADRDEASMENKQYVRNVKITNLYMRKGGGEWIPMYTPVEFVWQKLSPDDITTSYRKVIDNVKTLLADNTIADPSAGYKAAGVEAFAGSDNSFILQRNALDRVPVDGMSIDSCYMCDPPASVTASTGRISLKMDISAEMSYDPNFPMGDTGADGSTTDNLTFTRRWTGEVLDVIYTVDDKGVAQTTAEPVSEFIPGMEYRVYIHFSRTGVNLVAKELPWNYGGIHYITIVGPDEDPANE